MTLTPCLECGAPADGPRCAEHALPDNEQKAPTTARGYDETWTALSRRARKLQPFCTDCGTVEDLTADHSAEAWRRKLAGKTIRLRDVDVVCRSCNGRRGRARPPGEVPRSGGVADPDGKPRNGSYLITIPNKEDL